MQNKYELTDEFENVTLLFADISGFTAYSNYAKDIKQPNLVVQMLRQLFENFDKICLKYNVFKLYTIGDCYVVMGFTNSAQRNKENLYQEAYNGSSPLFS